MLYWQNDKKMNKKTITVFTPTYNRAYCLHQLYESLCRQTSNDFNWLVIDDGSTDNTKELVNKWKAEKKVVIEYYYKENGGMHTGHNVAYNLIETELNVCIDSDDYMPDEAVKEIINFWNENKSEKYAGILGLDCFKDGKIVSSKKFPKNIKSGKYSLLKSKYRIIGDIKFVYVTSIIKKYPEYPVFEGERFVPLGYKYSNIDKDYEMLFLNKILCIVDYMPDGSTMNIFNQYFKHPKGFAFSRKQSLKGLYNYKEKFIIAVHLVAESILAKQNPFKNNSEKMLTFLAIPLGIALYCYILFLNKK
jgi:glycosyltransferase involved in cell wall biosynthesis